MDDRAYVALDTETEIMDFRRGYAGRLVNMIGMSFTYDGEEANYVTNPDEWLEYSPGPENIVIFHNAKFDLAVLARAGLPLPIDWEDTMIASHLIDENMEHGLKPLAVQFLGVKDPMTFAEADRMRLLDPPAFEEYARNDARYTYQLWDLFQPLLEKDGLQRVYQLEKRLVPLVIEMETVGMMLDLPLLKTLGSLVRTEIDKCKQEIYALTGYKFDINSSPKLARVLYDEMEVGCGKTTKGGQRSVDREALEQVRGAYPIVDAVLRYRELEKLANTFIDVLPRHADKMGRVHPEFRSHGARTGRFSCSDPNVQQIPARSELGKKLRRAFIAGPGRKLVVADYSQMELRILAHYSQDPLLLEAYRGEVTVDLHARTASKMFGKPESGISTQERIVAKTINFGIAYGITPTGLFNRLRANRIFVSHQECEDYVSDYFHTYVGVKRFLEAVEVAIKKRGWVKNFFGRRRHLRGADKREIRQAQNFIIQATAADITKDAMVRLRDVLPMGAMIIAQVHDEIIVECDDNQSDGVKKLMVEILQDLPGLTVPMLATAGIGDNWGEAK